MTQFSSAGYLPAIRKHIESGKPFMGICVGLQALFEESPENSAVPGLGLIKGHLDRFDDSDEISPAIMSGTHCPYTIFPCRSQDQ
jgi:imidazole glycerol-phosphate synthase